MPPLEMFPKSQRVTFKFYEGVLLFLEENYLKVSIFPVQLMDQSHFIFQAESHLNEAWQLCHKDAHAQSE
jgi:hypothetical protein